MNNQPKRNLTRRYLVPFLFITLAMALGLIGPLGTQSALAQATVVHQQVDFPIDITTFLDCTGEDIYLSGAVHRQSHYIVDGNGGVHFQSVNNDYDLSGIGLTSGLTYRRTGATVISYNIGSGGAQQFTAEDTLRFVRQGSGAVLQLHVTVHMTLNANGEITTVFENVRFACGS